MFRLRFSSSSKCAEEDDVAPPTRPSSSSSSYNAAGHYVADTLAALFEYRLNLVEGTTTTVPSTRNTDHHHRHHDGIVDNETDGGFFFSLSQVDTANSEEHFTFQQQALDIDTTNSPKKDNNNERGGGGGVDALDFIAALLNRQGPTQQLLCKADLFVQGNDGGVEKEGAVGKRRLRLQQTDGTSTTLDQFFSTCSPPNWSVVSANGGSSKDGADKEEDTARLLAENFDEKVMKPFLLNQAESEVFRWNLDEFVRKRDTQQKTTEGAAGGEKEEDSTTAQQLFFFGSGEGAADIIPPFDEQIGSMRFTQITSTADPVQPGGKQEGGIAKTTSKPTQQRWTMSYDAISALNCFADHIQSADYGPKPYSPNVWSNMFQTVGAGSAKPLRGGGGNTNIKKKKKSDTSIVPAVPPGLQPSLVDSSSLSVGTVSATHPRLHNAFRSFGEEFPRGSPDGSSMTAKSPCAQRESATFLAELLNRQGATQRMLCEGRVFVQADELIFNNSNTASPSSPEEFMQVGNVPFYSTCGASAGYWSVPRAELNNTTANDEMTKMREHMKAQAARFDSTLIYTIAKRMGSGGVLPSGGVGREL